jgi:hypothetical protein
MNAWIPILVGVILVLLFGTIVYLKYRLSPKQEDKEEAKNFLLQLKDDLYALMIDTIIDFDYTKYTSIAEMEIEVINSVIDTCKQTIKNAIKDSQDILSILVLKCLDNDMIEKFILQLIEEYAVKEKVDTKIGEIIKDRYSEAEEEDKALAEQFADQDLYVEEEIPVKDLPPADEIIVPPAELEKLNPQVDEEESFNSEDESMEIVEEETKAEEV